MKSIAYNINRVERSIVAAQEPALGEVPGNRILLTPSHQFSYRL